VIAAERKPHRRGIGTKEIMRKKREGDGEWGQVEKQQAANTKQQASLPRHRSYESGTGRQASTAKAKAASGRPVKGGNGAGNKGIISET
jgi:hypothetical protein